MTAANSAVGAISERGQTVLNAYLLCRALGPSSRSSAELAQLTFEPTYVSAISGGIAEATWQLLDGRLPWPKFWFDYWSRGRRLIVGVADMFIDRGLSPHVFGMLARDGDTFRSLAEVIAWRGKAGRQYLRTVRRTLEGSPDPVISEKVRTLQWLAR